MKKLLPILMAFAMTAVSLTGWASGSKTAETAAAGSAPSVQAESSESADVSASAEETAFEDVSSENASDGAENNSEGVVRVGSLKGPTSMGLVSLMNSDTSANQYDFQMVTAADELVASIASGKLDIALVPANVASVLYNKTEGGISVIDINTLGVLYIVSADDSIKSVADLKGRTVYLTGKGTTPDYVIQYLLKANGLSEQDVKLEYKSEAAEVAAILKEKTDSIGLLPQPFVTVACAQNETLKIVLDLTAEWDMVQGAEGSRLVTGVTIVTNEFLKNNEEAVKVFLSDHKVSAKAAVSDPKTAAEQIVQAGIIEKAPIAQKALPYCNITFIEGEEMKAALSGYLNVLFEQDPKSVGGKLPADNFYYIEK